MPSNVISFPAFNPKPRKQSPFRTIGATGTEFFSGFLTNEEYYTDLVGSKAITAYDKMYRNDAQVRGTLYAVQLPIRQAKWYVESASDKPVDKEIAERLQKNLFKEMIPGWNDFLRQALSYLHYGFSIFEKVVKLYDDNKILLLKLAPRLQKSLYRWYKDDNDNFSGIQQFVQIKDSGAYQYIDIWRDKLLLFVNDQDGNNFEGISVLRSAYKHWYIKDQLYKIDAIGHDRWASGIPVATEPDDGANDADSGRVATVLENLHSREKSYVHLPGKWKLDLFEKSGSNESIIKSIQHHNEEIAKNILAQFINLGSTSSGSRALGEAFEELFMQSLNAIAGYIAERVNRHVIKQLVDMNWTVDEYPRLKHGRIILAQSRWLEGLNKIGLSQAVSSDTNIEQVIRESLGLPLLTEEQIKEREEMRKQVISNVGGNNNEKERMPKQEKKEEIKDEDIEDDKAAIDTINAKKLKDTKRTRELTEVEEMLCDFDEIEKCLNDGVDKFTKQVFSVKKQQAEFLSKEVLKKTADKIKIPYIDKLADRLFKEQKRQMNKGRRHLREELQRQKDIAKIQKLAAPELLDDDDFEDKEKVDQFLRDKSKSDAMIISNKTLGAALFALYNLDPEITTTEDKQNAIFESIMETGNRDINNIAEASTNKAYSLGRETQAKTYSEQIDFAVYSAVLDGGTCATCAPKDGVAHAIDDPRFGTPNPTCQGGDRCRCVNIYKTTHISLGTQELITPKEWERDDLAIKSGKKSVKEVLNNRRDLK